MKNLLLLLCLVISTTLSAQVISRTVTKDLDTLVTTKVPKTKVVSVTVEDDTTIQTLIKYVPVTTPNLPPVSNPGADQSITLPTNSVILNGGASTDPDGVITSYTWSKVTSFAGTLSSPTSSSTQFINLASGNHVVRLTVIDNRGASNSKDVAIVVFPVPTTGTTVNFTFTQIPITDPDLIAPGRGAEQWHNGSQRIPNPTESQPVSVENSLDVYYRFQWTQLEGATQGSYTWTYFDNLVKGAINKGQKLSFGIMTIFSGAENGNASYDGGGSSYPQYLHTLMQSEATNSRDWLSGGWWIPNFNSPNYIGRLRALHTAIRDRLNTQTYTATTGPNAGKAVLFANAVNVIDIRGYGNYGEWHSGGYLDNWANYPAGRQPTVATFKAIIDAHTQIFDKWPLVIMIAAFNGTPNSIPLFQPYAEIAHYAATARNAWGQVGWRKDQYGATDSYLAALLENNNVTWNGSTQLKNILMNTWKAAPITGEPPSWTVNGPDLMRQVVTYHTTSFGNGNYGPYPDATLRNQIRDAFKKCGYRLVTTGGKAVTNLTTIAITLNWQNIGIAPTYENWDIVYEAVSSTGVATTIGTSTFKPKLFQPSTQATVITDTFNENLSGQYTLRVTLKDPANYRQPGIIAIQGRQTNGTYNLGVVNL